MVLLMKLAQHSGLNTIRATTHPKVDNPLAA